MLTLSYYYTIIKPVTAPCKEAYMSAFNLENPSVMGPFDLAVNQEKATFELLRTLKDRKGWIAKGSQLIVDGRMERLDFDPGKTGVPPKKVALFELCFSAGFDSRGVSLGTLTWDQAVAAIERHGYRPAKPREFLAYGIEKGFSRKQTLIALGSPLNDQKGSSFAFCHWFGANGDYVDFFPIILENQALQIGNACHFLAVKQ